MPVDKSIFPYILEEKRAPDKGIIIKEGSKKAGMFIILRGRVKVKKKTSRGMLTIDVLKEGDVLGEMFAVEKEVRARTATLVADGPVVLGVLDEARLRAEFEALSPQLKETCRFVIRRLKEASEKISKIAGT